MVPAIRAWARWDSGPLYGAQVLSHHQQPDLSICACIPHEWVRGRDLVVDYVGMTVCWAAKVVHEQYLGRYPGLQHYPAWMRRERDCPDEFCGCGARAKYSDCHQNADQQTSPQLLELQKQQSRLAYFQELSLEGRPVYPPRNAWGDL